MMKLDRIKQVLKAVTVFAAWLVAVSAFASNWTLSPEPTKQIGVEIVVVSVLISNNLTGVLTGTSCDDCEPIQLRITPETKYYLSGDTLVDLARARSLTGKSAVVIYDVDSKVATKIGKLFDEKYD